MNTADKESRAEGGDRVAIRVVVQLKDIQKKDQIILKLGTGRGGCLMEREAQENLWW